jgi:DNA/RNA endonuclease YhcR with UshA esterase domain
MKKARMPLRKLNSLLPTHWLTVTGLNIILFMFLSAKTFSQTWTSPTGVVKHNGDSVRLIGYVTSARYFADARDAPTLINIGGKNSDQLITLLVKGDDRSNFTSAPETAYTEKYIQVVGKVQIYKGKPRIILHHEKQISILTEGAPDTE